MTINTLYLLKPSCGEVQEVSKQVRLSRATLEFQVLQVPTGLKVFNSQVICLISFTKLFRSKKSSIQNLSLPKKLSFYKFGMQEIVSHRFKENYNKKNWVHKYFGSKKIVGKKKGYVKKKCWLKKMLGPIFFWVQ